VYNVGPGPTGTSAIAKAGSAAKVEFVTSVAP